MTSFPQLPLADGTHDGPWLADARVLVTGASGFLGQPLCRRLADAGARVHAVSRTLRDPRPGEPKWWQCDLEETGAVHALLDAVRPDVILHLGGLVNGAPERALVLPTFHSLLTSTVNLLDAAQETGCRRIVLVGTLEEPDGGAEAVPTSPYGAAKWAATAYGRMYHRLFRTPVVTLRTFMTYGPGQPDWKVIPHTILSLLADREPALSSGERRLDWVYVDDVVEGFLRAAGTPGIEGTTIDLGSGRATSLREIVTRIAARVGGRARPAFGALPDRPFREPRVADTARTLASIAWRPLVGLDEGLARTVEWYRSRYEVEGPLGSRPAERGAGR
jgi:UDP-glucose 4-epimerase